VNELDAERDRATLANRRKGGGEGTARGAFRFERTRARGTRVREAGEREEREREREVLLTERELIRDALCFVMHGGRWVTWDVLARGERRRCKDGSSEGGEVDGAWPTERARESSGFPQAGCLRTDEVGGGERQNTMTESVDLFC